ncbi:MAG TPA: hypothetical protein DCR78_18870 [Pseudomonas sp.]|jgi:uncharacterized protein YjiS (DUF1127 family)|uniref:Uncharacterized protein YjiS (DUF1127 family) n=1 Tax=Stutzerimonas stutzeri TaxID=316 RepID=A0A5S5BBH9_STUST|nr:MULTISPECIES: DUF1127 domain-containing protein [Pseudomonadaceae]MBU0812966.1 DUF1127 domain-containing protein [Gammaproteobacteria bacterium]HAQ88480.1 hypothetical protein [Pseudomonas sp.]MBK3849749.1 DUF1127 domain-containing protein [Stutzerimonas xanthomarina]MBU0851570.1 DUF1127 domain-containing protein [Gammaproteobacteria bacterium]MBU1300463.1 DUF1127 domain-containing protein [Gammaproteobacteria bacterium]|tara:strand:+ start:4525 stop:4728 length:204 start_codon:yes stop_codon:yes gene_type:complete
MERVLTWRQKTAIGLPPLHRVLQQLRLWQRRARTRQHLAALDERQLADVGISQSERMDELSKPFWRG